jgi:Ca2+-binding EF-hand superfamily protein
MRPCAWTQGAGACLLAGLVLVLPAARAQTPLPPRVQAPPAARAQAPARAAGEVQDIAFFGGPRPILLRIRVLVDGNSLSAAREQYVKRWLDYLDRDGDGVLSPEEARLVPSVQTLQQLRFNGFFLPNLRNKSATLAELDTNRDGKVSLAELSAHFARAGIRSVEVVAGGSRQALYDGPSEVLFKHLDSKKQGKLSKEGVRQAADAVLQKFDTDDDETLSLEELFPASNALLTRQQLAFAGQPLRPPGGAFLAVRSPDSDRSLGLMLLTHFDKNADLKLSRAESGLDRKTFDGLDKNGDGMLDLDELSCWHQRPADAEIVVRLGKRKAGQPPVELLPAGGKAMPAKGAEKLGEDRVRLTFGDAQVSFGRTEAPVAIRPGVGSGRFLLQQFQAADTRKQGFLTEKDLGPRAQFLRPLLPLADRNGDGKVTVAEMTALVDLLEGAPRTSATVAVAEHGRALFQLLDVDQDGRLSLRELRTAWDRLAPLDTNGDGFITPEEIARQFEVTVSQGSPNGNPRLVAPPTRVRPVGVPVRAPARGPVWFRKMDLNGDGYVSPREFLGSQEEFRRIDTDRDGFISPEEAERYDAKVRAKKTSRR